jgi:hypothetical protein
MNIQQWVAIALRSAYPDMGTSRDPGVAVEKFYRKHGRLPNEKDHKCTADTCPEREKWEEKEWTVRK